MSGVAKEALIRLRLIHYWVSTVNKEKQHE